MKLKGLFGLAGEINWGRRAMKIRATLGLRMLVIAPCL
jgi:hypothetical protein